MLLAEPAVGWRGAGAVKKEGFMDVLHDWLGGGHRAAHAAQQYTATQLRSGRQKREFLMGAHTVLGFFTTRSDLCAGRVMCNGNRINIDGGLGSNTFCIGCHSLMK